MERRQTKKFLWQPHKKRRQPNCALHITRNSYAPLYNGNGRVYKRLFARLFVCLFVSWFVCPPGCGFSIVSAKANEASPRAQKNRGKRSGKMLKKVQKK